ncbi:MAG: serine kinase [Bacteroidales bacterium]|nr:serine kinase [Bacteroidales bacterium]
MTIAELTKKAELTSYTGTTGIKKVVTGGYISDLLSDVMGRATQGDIWITMQSHLNIIAIASLRDLPAIIIVNGTKPSEEMIEKAINEEIALLGTEKGAFETGGMIWNILNGNS